LVRRLDGIGLLPILICPTASAIDTCSEDSDSGGVSGATWELTTDCWITEAEGRRLDLPTVRLTSDGGETTTGDMGGTGDDRAEDDSLSMPLMRKEAGKEADGPDASEESSSAKSDFFLRRNSAAEPSGIPGLDDKSDLYSSSNSLCLGCFFFFLMVPVPFPPLAGLSKSSSGRCTMTVSRNCTVLVTFLAGLGNLVERVEDGRAEYSWMTEALRLGLLGPASI
jgi:hypothetical protein